MKKNLFVWSIILVFCLLFAFQAYCKEEKVEIYGKVTQIESDKNYINVESGGNEIGIFITSSTEMKYEGKKISLKDINTEDVLQIEGNFVDKNIIMAKKIKIIAKAEAKELIIYTIIHDATKQLMPGEKITVTIYGTPGAIGSFDITNLFSEVSMKEIAEGQYLGEYKVQTGDSVTDTTVVGHLLWKNGTKVSMTASNKVSIGTPYNELQTSQILPAVNSTADNNRPNILIVIDSDTSKGIIPQTAKLNINGKEVTKNASINDYVISYLPSSNLPEGQNNVLFTAIDYQGNQVKKEWSFYVSKGQQGPVIYNVEHNAGDIVLSPGDRLIVTMTASPGGTGNFDIVNFKNGIPMVETKSNPGVYTGEYTISKTDQLTNAYIIGHLKLFNQETTFQANKPVSFNYSTTGTPPTLSPPQITSPANGATIETPFVIKGTTLAGYNVEITISSQSTFFGVFNVGSDPVVRTVTADSSGNFEDSFNSLMSSSGTKYTIKAVTIAPSGERSGETVLTVVEK